jgi:polyisoprenoid-binding protein YceI
MKTVKFYILIFLGLLLISQLTIGDSLLGEYHVNKSKDNLVKFISDAKVETFEGVTSDIDGYLYFSSLQDLSDSKLYFEVDLPTLDTGIGLRNRQMRNNYLETDKYRYAKYKGKLTSVSEISDGTYDVMVDGKMTIHGVTNKLPVTGKLIKTENGYRIKTDFKVSLTDYNIEVPELMFMRIDEVMKLELDFYLKKVSKN